MKTPELVATIKLEVLLDDQPYELEFLRQAVKEKLVRDQLRAGCPANNKTCHHFIQGCCVHPFPRVSVLEPSNKTVCGSYKG